MTRSQSRKLAVLAVVLLAGCSVQASPNNTAPAATVGEVSYYAEVYETHLSDGTRCAVMTGGRSGGISCDWDRRANVSVKRDDPRVER